jgi:hypothetical protein
MSIQSRLETVKAARQRYDHLAGVARAQAICAFVVWEHRAEGWGRFNKRDGTLSADVIALKVAGETQVHTFDILGDSENAARPQFGPTEPTGRGDLARWVEPVRPFDVPEPPVPVPVPVPVPQPTAPLDIAALQAEVAALRSRLDALAAGPGLDLDPVLNAVVDQIVVSDAETTQATLGLSHSHGVGGLTLRRRS